MKPKLSKVVVLGAVFNKNDELLVSQRSDPKIPDAHMKWDFVGGTNEFGETLEQTLHRELEEEAGITVEIESLIPTYTQKSWSHKKYDQHTLVFCFKCKLLTENQTKKDKKINKLEWKKSKDLKQLEFLTTCQLFLSYLLE